MFIEILILILGFILLVAGANYLVKGASNIAKKFNISEILIGLTIVALGTSLPELVVSIVSAATNSTDIVLGNVIGSNICNLLLILGLVVVLQPIKFEKTTIRQNFPLLLIITCLILIMGIELFSKDILSINRFDSIVLLLIALFYFIIPIVQHLKKEKINNKSANIKEENTRSLLTNIIYILLGGLALKYGGDFVVDSATNIAHTFNISERVIGLTIVALGTSLPELITSVVAIIKKNEDIAEGNIIGSCIINSCLILGAGAFINDIFLSADNIKDLLFLILIITIIWLLALVNKDNTLKRNNGILLLIIYLVYSIRLFV